MTTDFFLNQLQDRLVSFENAISTNEKDWIIKGFIDIYKRIYTISIDTKIVSKVLELLLFPLLSQFAMDNNLDIELSPQQNFYPDVTFIDRKNSRLFALDIKTTYRIDDEKVNRLKEKYGKYLLMVSRFQYPHKDQFTVIKAFNILIKKNLR